MQANWDPRDEKSTGCFTHLFNREPAIVRSLAEEQKLMAGRSQRVAYWYTKEWALLMAEKISMCGGKASFPAPVRQR